MLDTNTKTEPRAEWWYVPAFLAVFFLAGTAAITFGWISAMVEVEDLGDLLITVWSFIAMLGFGCISMFSLVAAGVAVKEVIEDH